MPHLSSFQIARAVSVTIAVFAMVSGIPRAGVANADENVPRIEMSINSGWKFIRDDVADAQTVNFDDSSWASVDLPHSWNATDGEQPNYYRGPGWYRLKLDIGADLSGKSLFLRFGAASLVAQVYVNGEEAGIHKGGFAAFCFDVTKLLRIGKNLIAVRVSNAWDPNIAPLSGDFTVYGGLYRKVELLALNPVSISPIDDASSGIYLKTDVSDASATVKITAKLRNASDHDVAVDVIYSIVHAGGKQVQRTTVKETVLANSKADAIGTLNMEHPHLWDGRNDPYMYRTVVVLMLDGKTIDQVEQPLGLRYFKVDPESGLLLNGKPYDMHGVNYHQGRPGVGFASTRAMMDEDYRLISELGCTGVRMAHYQHADYEHSLCDHLGILVWSELALVNRLTDSPEFRENVQQQLREMIKQGFNHPSILFWSMYNEPAVNARSSTQAQWHLVSDLVDAAHGLDPGRLTTGAAQSGLEGPLLSYMDLTAVNRYYGWYGGSLHDWTHQLDDLHQKHPNRSLGVSEYGAGASISQHEVDPTKPTPSAHWHPEEWEALFHESAWQAMNENQWLWCKLAWCMFDFGSAGRREGDRAGINDKGLVTADRRTLKDAYFYYQACWTTKPFVHINDRRFSPHPTGDCELKVYSNCSSVELWLDGTSLGVKTSPTHVFVWPKVELTKERATLRAVGINDQVNVVDTIDWTLSDSSVPASNPSAAP
jgi:beta-galactosidase